MPWILFGLSLLCLFTSQIVDMKLKISWFLFSKFLNLKSIQGKTQNNVIKCARNKQKTENNIEEREKIFRNEKLKLRDFYI